MKYKGIQILFSYFIGILVLAVMAILDISYGNTLTGQIIRSLLLASIFIGIVYILILIISVLYVANCSKNTKHNSISNLNKKSDVCNTITFPNWCRNVAYCLTEMKYPKRYEGYASHPQNDRCNK